MKGNQEQKLAGRGGTDPARSEAVSFPGGIGGQKPTGPGVSDPTRSGGDPISWGNREAEARQARRAAGQTPREAGADSFPRGQQTLLFFSEAS